MPEAAWKPWAAGLLVAGAVGMIARNVVLPLLHRDTVVEDRSPMAAAPETIADFETSPSSPGQQEPPSSTDTSRLTGWNSDGRRDPFEARCRGCRWPVSDGPVSSSGRSVGSSKPAQVRIGAIAWGRTRMALVDGHAVGIGDSLPDGILIDISSDRLAIRSPTGDTIHRFRQGKSP